MPMTHFYHDTSFSYQVGDLVRVTRTCQGLPQTQKNQRHGSFPSVISFIGEGEYGIVTGYSNILILVLITDKIYGIKPTNIEAAALTRTNS